ncbi:MAG: hypothetical protein R2750_02090 [Bacteroidales bacterium]
MNRIVNLIVSLFAALSLSIAQVPVGETFDINGLSFDGYFEPLSYSPEEQIFVTHNSDSFEKGLIYYSNGEKQAGYIKYEEDKIWFKENLFYNTTKEKIKPYEIQSLIIGVDSFFTISNFYIGSKNHDKPEFVQFITQFDSLTFIKHYRFASGTAVYYGGSSPITETFLVRLAGSDKWHSFPDKSEKFKIQALRYFGHIPYLKTGIESGQFDSDDMMTLIKMAEYQYNFLNNRPIYFDNSWQEVKDMNRAMYKAIIIEKVDSIWTIEYSTNNNVLFKVDYSSFYPSRKNGLFKSYFTDGRLRKEAIYLNDTLKNVKTYSHTGILKYEYNLAFTEINGDISIERTFVQINDSDGKNLMESQREFEIEIYDSVMKRTYVRSFQDGKLVQSFVSQEKNVVYQNCDPNYDFKIKSLQKKINLYLEDRKYEQAISDNAQGIVLIHVTINEKGYVVDHRIFNIIHPELDALVRGFATQYLSDTSVYKFRFPSYKPNKDKLYCEFVVPISFSIKRFYRPPANYYYHNHMFQWQMMQQPMPSIQVRTF